MLAKKGCRIIPVSDAIAHPHRPGPSSVGTSAFLLFLPAGEAREGRLGSVDHQFAARQMPPKRFSLIRLQSPGARPKLITIEKEQNQ
jgi:hypothetical protein